MPSDLLALPWQLQLTLASGYAAYALAYAGIRAHHKTIEITFSTLVFGLIATGSFNVLTSHEILSPPAAMAVAFALTACAGLGWRKFGRRWVRDALRVGRVSHADEYPSAWKSIFDEPDWDVSQIAVQLDNGSWVRCDDTTKFDGAPFAPCILGEDGGIILYLTHEDTPNGEEREMKTTRVPSWGDRMTYIPPNRVSRVTIRHKRR